MERIFNFLFQKKIIAPILILICTSILAKLAKTIVNKLFTRGKDNYEKKKRTTIIELSNKVLKFFLYAIAILMILDIYGINTEGLIASLGIAGVVLGLALQDTVQDLMSGIYIILENYYVIGDIIKINDFQGEVIDISLKSTKVKSAIGEVNIFSNRNVNSVINLSQARAGIKILIPTAYEESTEKVEKALEEVVAESKKLADVYKDSIYLGIDSFGQSEINYAIMIYCKSSEQWLVKRKVLKLIKEKYESENIKIPYNQIEVHNGKEI